MTKRAVGLLIFININYISWIFEYDIQLISLNQVTIFTLRVQVSLSHLLKKKEDKIGIMEQT